MPRNNQLLHFAFREDKQWKLQQIQDARNHVSQAIYLLNNRDDSYQFRTGAEVLKVFSSGERCGHCGKQSGSSWQHHA
ncbi:rogdi atypical leucine zipper [Phyllostomus discolor]|uniref:Protein rogdi homolog n=1 Tax=Phyllostomus discolor TaxID=89673 RepID=A0A834BBX3_9CHIR|nr:rogdi atypical leucine zipper [Phyllostomus discolor]